MFPMPLHSNTVHHLWAVGNKSMRKDAILLDYSIGPRLAKQLVVFKFIREFAMRFKMSGMEAPSCGKTYSTDEFSIMLSAAVRGGDIVDMFELQSS